MASLLIFRGNRRDEYLKRCVDIFREQNPGPEVALEADGLNVLISGNGSAPTVTALETGEFIAVVGFLIYQTKTGVSASRALLRDISRATLNEEELGGAFAAVSWDGVNVQLFTDWLGNTCAYQNSAGAVWSTSFLATLMSCETCTVNPQGAWEYIFLGAPNGEHTVTNEVQRLNPEFMYLPASGNRVRRPNPLAKQPIQAASFDHTVAELVDSLDGVFDAVAEEFGDKIDTALSGGYDSRLMLAALRSKGISPRVHVYGKEEDEDVLIAKSIARGEGFDLTHVDKSKFSRPVDQDDWDRTVYRNFMYFDATPPDGIFNSGGDLTSRQSRMEEGYLALNGGGGEIYRNFFYLPNKHVPLRALLETFYSRIDRLACSESFNRQIYLDEIRRKMLESLGCSENDFERVDIERLYPLFRCRYWMAHNTSVNNIIGRAFTPFMYLPTVKPALKVPIEYKNHGLLEGAMIDKIDKRLASYPSNDRKSFTHKPGLLEYARDYSTIYRPIWVRRMTYPLKNRILNLTSPHTVALFHHLDTLLAHKWDEVRTLVVPEKIKDPEQLHRAATVQYLVNHLQIQSKS